MDKRRALSNVVELGGSIIPLSTDFAERVLPIISNQMGLVPSCFRNDNQEQTTRMVAVASASGSFTGCKAATSATKAVSGLLTGGVLTRGSLRQALDTLAGDTSYEEDGL